MQFNFNDGGRADAGFKGSAGDCVTRAVAIATGQEYVMVYDEFSEENKHQRTTQRSSRNSGRRTASHGINTSRKWFKDYMAALGWTFTATMGIGTGCKVHLRDGELPAGRLIVRTSRHLCAVIDGVINDTHDPSRGGTRCVYGYWRKQGQ